MVNITVNFPNQNEKKCQDWVESQGQVHVLTYNFPVEHSTHYCLTSKHILADTFPSLVKYHIFPPINNIAMHFFFKHYLPTGQSMNILTLKKHSQKIVTTLPKIFFFSPPFLPLTAA